MGANGQDVGPDGRNCFFLMEGKSWKDEMMPHIRKLARFAQLSEDEREVLTKLGHRTENIPTGQDIAITGERPPSSFILLDGFACRYRLLKNGGRQILNFVVPGDLCDLHAFLQKEMDHSIMTMMPTRIAAISTEDVFRLFEHHPRISVAMWLCALQDEAIMRERVVALGRRNARARVSYLLCEMLWRLEVVGKTTDGTFNFPLTQIELADCLGLTSVHINRTLKHLRAEGLISIGRGTVHVIDVDRLADVADIDSGYLQIRRSSDKPSQLSPMQRQHV